MKYFDYDVALAIDMLDLEIDFEELPERLHTILSKIDSKEAHEIFATEQEILIIKYSLTCHDVVFSEIKQTIETLLCREDKFAYKMVSRMDLVLSNVLLPYLEDGWEY